MAPHDFIKKTVYRRHPLDGDGRRARLPLSDREIQVRGAAHGTRFADGGVQNEGQVADVFGPGMYKLTTQTLLLTNPGSWELC